MKEKNLAFSNNSLPELETGSYRIIVTQSSDNLKGFNDPAKVSLDFSLISNRFALVDDAVYSVYPPRDSTGEYNRILPHVTLNSSSFPWEIKRMYNNVIIPWVMLMLLDEDEFTSLNSMTLQDAINPSPDIYFPDSMRKLQESEDPASTCFVLDIDKSVFKSIFPEDKDLQYMAHVRSVNLNDKVTDSTVNGEHFSCLVANRYPKSNNKVTDSTVNGEHLSGLVANSQPESENGCAQTLCIVSIDGYHRNIDNEDYKKVRFIVLYNWSFTNVAEPYDFEKLMSNLNISSLYQTKKISTDTNINNLLKLGYIPMNHSLRDNGLTVSWYKSPLQPCPPQKEKEVSVGASDAKLKYDPETGMFDASYAAAWQIGKMLCWQNIGISKNLMKWRIDNKLKSVYKQNNHFLMTNGFTASLDASSLFNNLFDSIPIVDYTGLSGTEYESTLKKLARKIKMRSDSFSAENDVLTQDKLLEMMTEDDENE